MNSGKEMIELQLTNFKEIVELNNFIIESLEKINAYSIFVNSFPIKIKEDDKMNSHIINYSKYSTNLLAYQHVFVPNYESKQKISKIFIISTPKISGWSKTITNMTRLRFSNYAFCGLTGH